MTSSEFLISLLQDVFVKFPAATIRYEFRQQRSSHIVEIMPKEIFENDKYIDAEIEVSDKFRELYPNENLVFISEGSINKITLPTFILNNISICFKNDELVTEPIFKNYTYKYTSVKDNVLAIAA